MGEECAGKSRQLNTPLCADILTVITQLIAIGVYKTYTMVFGKSKCRKNSDVHPCLTEFSKTQGEATILKKKKNLVLFYFLVIYYTKDDYRHIIHG